MFFHVHLKNSSTYLKYNVLAFLKQKRKLTSTLPGMLSVAPFPKKCHS